MGKLTKEEEVRGRPVSGRVWKTVQKQRFSSVRTKAVKELSSTWDQKMQKRRKLEEIKALEREMKERKAQEKEASLKAKEEREKRRLENEMKATKFQVISKTEKLKTMSKKQLRMIKKTRMGKHGVVELVGAYEK